MGAEAWISDVTEANFEAEVLERSRTMLVLVDFWAEWCGPCRQLGPLLEEVLTEYPGKIWLAKVDIDRAQRLTMEHGVQSVPTVIAYSGGQPVNHFQGALPLPRLRGFVEDLLPSAEDDQVEDARSLESRDPAAAEASYREALEADPKHEGARLGLARLALARGDDDAARSELEQIPEGSEHRDEAQRLTAQISLRQRAQAAGDASGDDPRAVYAQGCAAAGRGEFPAALETWLKAGRADKELARGDVRDAMVEVFTVLGPGDPLTKRYRGQLGLLLF